MRKSTLGLIVCLSVTPLAHARQLAIIGDSGATGAVTNPSLDATISGLLKTGLEELIPDKIDNSGPQMSAYPDPAEFNIVEPLDPPTRLFYSQAETKEDDKTRLEMQAKASSAVDTEEYSWGYMVGRKLGIAPQDIFITAQDGQRIDSIKTQFERLKEASPEGPDDALVFFNANDVCDEKVLEEDPAQVVGRYKQSLKDQLSEVRASMTANANGTNIYLMAPLPVLDVLTNESVQNKEVPFHGGSLTCGELRSGKTEREIFNTDIIKKMSGMCGSILRTTPDDKDRLQKLKVLFSEISRVQGEVIEELRADGGESKITFTHIPQTTEIQFDGDDIANDCFHPGILGHVKIARTVLKILENAAAR